jgi:aminoglycoside phosphotransferase (APT) family kinase protein
VHGDFRAGNIIVDPASGRLAGVIDRGNAAVGDPALNFMTLVLWRGWAFTLQALAGSIRRRADPALHLEWVCDAFSLAPSA